jgi:hypothetical protein
LPLLIIAGSEAKRLRVEVDRLREENTGLMKEQFSRETEIRMEVSEEMAMRSAHLLNQIQELQLQLDVKEREKNGSSRMADVTKSVKKARRKQLDKANEDMHMDLEEAEEELSRVKAEYEAEIAQLKADKRRLEKEVTEWKKKTEKLTAALTAETRGFNSAPVSTSVTTSTYAVSEVENNYKGKQQPHHHADIASGNSCNVNQNADCSPNYSRSPPAKVRSPLAPVMDNTTSNTSSFAFDRHSNASPKLSLSPVRVYTNNPVAHYTGTGGLGGMGGGGPLNAGGAPNSAATSAWESSLRNGGRSNSPVRFVTIGGVVSASGGVGGGGGGTTSPLRGGAGGGGGRAASPIRPAATATATTSSAGLRGGRKAVAAAEKRGAEDGAGSTTKVLTSASAAASLHSNPPPRVTRSRLIRA